MMRHYRKQREEKEENRVRDNEGPKDLQEVERGCVMVKKDEKSVIELAKIASGRESEHHFAVGLGDDLTVPLMSRKEENTYYLKGDLGTEECMMLVDTGCSHSVMPCDLYAKLDGDSKLQWRPPEGHGVLADGSQVPIQGIGKVKFQLGDLMLEHSFQLAHIDGTILLGMDFLKKQKCVLDFERGILKLSSYTTDSCDLHGSHLANGRMETINDSDLSPITVIPDGDTDIQILMDESVIWNIKAEPADIIQGHMAAAPQEAWHESCPSGSMAWPLPECGELKNADVM